MNSCASCCPWDRMGKAERTAEMNEVGTMEPPELPSISGAVIENKFMRTDDKAEKCSQQLILGPSSILLHDVRRQ